MIKLIEKGYLFLTDDALFIDKEKNLIRVNTFFSYRKKYPNNINLEEYSKKINNEKIIIDFKLAKKLINLEYADTIEDYIFFKLSDIKKVQELKEPFPCIPRESFWCLSFLIKQKQNEYIKDILEKSIYEWNEITKNSRFIKIDFQDLEKFTNEFVKHIEKLRG